jgi:hypothetical protein
MTAATQQTAKHHRLVHAAAQVLTTKHTQTNPACLTTLLPFPLTKLLGT